MDVAVAGVEDVGDPEVVPLADRGDVPEDVRQLGAGDDAVLGAERRAQPADRAEGRLAALPDRDVLGLLPGPPGDRLLDRAAVRLDDLGDRLRLAVEARRRGRRPR